MSRLVNPTDLSFLLNDVFAMGKLAEFTRYQDYDAEAMNSVLAMAEKIAESDFLPHNSKADANEPTFDGETITTIADVKVAWQKYAESGLLSARHDYDVGGMQLPALLSMACNSYFMAANPATAAYPFLTTAAANVIQAFGNVEQKAHFLPGMFSGRFAGTMALTEPDVGSS